MSRPLYGDDKKMICLYGKEQHRRRTARVKAAEPIRDCLLGLGGEETNDPLIICFEIPKTIKAYGNMWSHKGKFYIRWANLGPKNIQTLTKLLDIKKIPAKNPLRRKLLKGVVKDQISIDEFYEVVK